MTIKKKTVMILGASGFIGRNLSEYLSIRDDIFQYTYGSGKTCISFSGGEERSIDVFRERETLFSEILPDVLILLAWNVSDQSYWTSYENCLWTNATISIAKDYYDRGGKYIIFAGTSAEYNYSAGYLKEEDCLTVPDSMYGITKQYCTNVISKLAEYNGALFCEARIFGIYGKYERSEKLFSNTIKKLLNDCRIDNKCGNLVRDYIYVKDAARAIVHLMDKEAKGVFNICTGNPVRIKDIIETIADKLGKRDKVTFSGESEDYPLIVGDSTKLRKTGFTFEYDLDKGINEMLDWMGIKI